MDDAGVNIDRLIEEAVRVRKNAAALYSGFQVGATIEDSDGRTWSGCNVESSSFGLSICAERVALTSAIAGGVRDFRRIVIAASGKGGLVQPCGACRQLLHDYAPGIEVTVYDPETDERETFQLEELFPHPFGGSALPGGEA